jgi:predicted RNA binding protein YcfA (HicA-like mRNA interferase family)
MFSKWALTKQYYIWYYKGEGGMDKRAQLKEKIKRNRRNVLAEDLMDLLLMYGFNEARVSGDHYQFKKEGFRTQTIPRQNPVWIRIVNQVLDIVEEIENLEN